MKWLCSPSSLGTIWKKVTMCSPHLRNGNLCFLSLSWNIRFVYFPPLINLFSHLLTLVGTHGYLFYTLGYNLMLLYFVQIVPALAIGSSFSWLLCSSYISHQCVCVTISYFLIPQDNPGSSCIFLTSALESSISPRSPGSFSWKMVLEAKI